MGGLALKERSPLASWRQPSQFDDMLGERYKLLKPSGGSGDRRTRRIV